ncbi:hypothetical protein Tco_0965911 [Tanacetum coccineum]
MGLHVTNNNALGILKRFRSDVTNLRVLQIAAGRASWETEMIMRYLNRVEFHGHPIRIRRTPDYKPVAPPSSDYIQGPIGIHRQTPPVPSRTRNDASSLSEEQPILPVDSPTAEVTPGNVTSMDPETHPRRYEDDEIEDAISIDASYLPALHITSQLPPLTTTIYIPPPVDRMDVHYPVEQPPRKRLYLSSPIGSRYEIGESSTARPTRGRGIDYTDLSQPLRHSRDRTYDRNVRIGFTRNGDKYGMVETGGLNLPYMLGSLDGLSPATQTEASRYHRDHVHSIRYMRLLSDAANAEVTSAFVRDCSCNAQAPRWTHRPKARNIQNPELPDSSGDEPTVVYGYFTLLGVGQMFIEIYGEVAVITRFSRTHHADAIRCDVVYYTIVKRCNIDMRGSISHVTMTWDVSKSGMRCDIHAACRQGMVWSGAIVKGEDSYRERAIFKTLYGELDGRLENFDSETVRSVICVRVRFVIRWDHQGGLGGSLFGSSHYCFGVDQVEGVLIEGDGIRWGGGDTEWRAWWDEHSVCAGLVTRLDLCQINLYCAGNVSGGGRHMVLQWLVELLVWRRRVVMRGWVSVYLVIVEGVYTLSKYEVRLLEDITRHIIAIDHNSFEDKIRKSKHIDTVDIHLLNYRVLMLTMWGVHGSEWYVVVVFLDFGGTHFRSDWDYLFQVLGPRHERELFSMRVGGHWGYWWGTRVRDGLSSVISGDRGLQCELFVIYTLVGSHGVDVVGMIERRSDVLSEYSERGGTWMARHALIQMYALRDCMGQVFTCTESVFDQVVSHLRTGEIGQIHEMLRNSHTHNWRISGITVLGGTTIVYDHSHGIKIEWIFRRTLSVTTIDFRRVTRISVRSIHDRLIGSKVDDYSVTIRCLEGIFGVLEVRTYFICLRGLRVFRSDCLELGNTCTRCMRRCDAERHHVRSEWEGVDVVGKGVLGEVGVVGGRGMGLDKGVSYGMVMEFKRMGGTQKSSYVGLSHQSGVVARIAGSEMLKDRDTYHEIVGCDMQHMTQYFCLNTEAATDNGKGRVGNRMVTVQGHDRHTLEGGICSRDWRYSVRESMCDDEWDRFRLEWGRYREASRMSEVDDQTHCGDRNRYRCVSLDDKSHTVIEVDLQRSSLETSDYETMSAIKNQRLHLRVLEDFGLRLDTDISSSLLGVVCREGLARGGLNVELIECGVYLRVRDSITSARDSHDQTVTTSSLIYRGLGDGGGNPLVCVPSRLDWEFVNDRSCHDVRITIIVVEERDGNIFVVDDDIRQIHTTTLVVVLIYSHLIDMGVIERHCDQMAYSTEHLNREECRLRASGLFRGGEVVHKIQSQKCGVGSAHLTYEDTERCLLERDHFLQGTLLTSLYSGTHLCVYGLSTQLFEVEASCGYKIVCVSVARLERHIETYSYGFEKIYVFLRIAWTSENVIVKYWICEDTMVPFRDSSGRLRTELCRSCYTIVRVHSTKETLYTFWVSHIARVESDQHGMDVDLKSEGNTLLEQRDGDYGLTQEAKISHTGTLNVGLRVSIYGSNYAEHRYGGEEVVLNRLTRLGGYSIQSEIVWNGESCSDRMKRDSDTSRDEGYYVMVITSDGMSTSRRSWHTHNWMRRDGMVVRECDTLTEFCDGSEIMHLMRGITSGHTVVIRVNACYRLDGHIEMSENKYSEMVIAWDMCTEAWSV